MEINNQLYWLHMTKIRACNNTESARKQTVASNHKQCDSKSRRKASNFYFALTKSISALTRLSWIVHQFTSFSVVKNGISTQFHHFSSSNFYLQSIVCLVAKVNCLLILPEFFLSVRKEAMNTNRILL